MPRPFAPEFMRSRGRSCLRTLRHLPLGLKILLFTTVSLLILLAFNGVFRPSYINLPPHYTELLENSRSGSLPGRVNLHQEKIFIAASLYDPKGEVAAGVWGERILSLIDLLGPENTFLSIYESDSGVRGTAALENLARKVPCEHRILHEDEIILDNPATVTLPDGEQAVKRIDYLAAARNKALDPLEHSNATAYDKILYLNDVVFDPVEASQLLFSTNLQANGRTDYKAACAVDFKSAFLMYDTLATRDYEGWSMGLPIFPFFPTSGSAVSRNDILRQRDAVRVGSCWGGLVAFDARYFQSSQLSSLGIDETAFKPVRFRAETDLFWEYSECCLIHADLWAFPTPSEVYMNPYVRTAYDLETFNGLGLGRRFERMLPFFQNVINHVVGLPFENTRRLIKKGQPLSKTVFEHNPESDDGSWRTESLPARPGGYCAIRNLMVKRIHRDKENSNWETISKDQWASMGYTENGILRR